MPHPQGFQIPPGTGTPHCHGQPCCAKSPQPQERGHPRTGAGSPGVLEDAGGELPSLRALCVIEVPAPAGVTQRGVSHHWHPSPRPVPTPEPRHGQGPSVTAFPGAGGAGGVGGAGSYRAAPLRPARGERRDTWSESDRSAPPGPQHPSRGAPPPHLLVTLGEPPGQSRSWEMGGISPSLGETPTAPRMGFLPSPTFGCATVQVKPSPCTPCPNFWAQTTPPEHTQSQAQLYF